jgi:hypothetical protein
MLKIKDAEFRGWGNDSSGLRNGLTVRSEHRNFEIIKWARLQITELGNFVDDIGSLSLGEDHTN